MRVPMVWFLFRPWLSVATTVVQLYVVNACTRKNALLVPALCGLVHSAPVSVNEMLIGVLFLRYAVTVDTLVPLNEVTFTPRQTVPPALGVVSDTVAFVTLGTVTTAL